MPNDDKTCERIALRVLENFEASNTGWFSSKLSADKFALSKTKKENFEIKEVIENEPQEMTHIDSSNSSAFKCLSQVNLRGKNEDD